VFSVISVRNYKYMKKILVAGGKGSLGTSLYNIVKNKKDYLFTDVDDLDITSKYAVNKFFSKNKISVVLNYAAYTNVDLAESEKEKCYNINVIGTENLVEMTKKYNIPILYISTDYVFDGKLHFNKAYSETDKTAPISYYGKTKLLGEEIIIRNEKHFIVRTEWLYGKQGNNFVKTIVSLLKEKDELKIVNDQVGALTNAETLNKIILKLIKTDKYGIYNITNNGSGSRFDIVFFIAKYLGNINCNLIPIPSNVMNTPAKRPLNSKLSLEKITKLLDIDIPDWKTDLKKYLQEINN
jgi:dTDP-4-dehydrorhamnose reductase